MTDLIVGCPVRQRNWILPIWREHVLESLPSDINLRFAFVIGADDLESISAISSWGDASIIPIQEPTLKFNRNWGDKTRYHHMVFIRNTLLTYVRIKRPDLFLSLDSDILLGKETLSQLVDTIQNKDFGAVAGLTYLDRTDKLCTNVGNYRPDSSSYKRVVSNGVHEVDILMAIKMMTPEAYNIDYSYHRLGEDLGWSKNAKEAGLKLGMDGRTPNKHIMKPEDLDRIDKRVGW